MAPKSIGDSGNYDGATEERPPDRQARSVAPARFYLLLFEGDSTRVVHLRTAGRVIIGRAHEATVQLKDNSVSRQHARIDVGPDGAELTDLGSQNGTVLNGQRITGTHPLATGDVIEISTFTLVFHASSRASNADACLDYDNLLERLSFEVDRALRFQRPLALVCAHLVAGGHERPDVIEAVRRSARQVDLVGSHGPEHLLLVLPECSVAQAAEVVARMHPAIAARVPAARIGLASVPEDGCDAETLIGAARAAAQRAEPGGVGRAAEGHRCLDLGGLPVIVADVAMIHLYALVERIARSDLSVVIAGETGTGKEVVARALHHWSARCERPMVTLNCSALPENLIESELFGYRKGAFTGAMTGKPGLLEAAEGGTVFLDEVGELSSAAQAKLLRALETKRVIRLGDIQERAIDVRVVSATNRDLGLEVKMGRFRHDLFFRLRGAQLWLPPLRDRRREIALLARMFLDQASHRLGRPPPAIAPEALNHMALHLWPGNIRELKNFMDYAAAVVVEGGQVERAHFTQWASASGEPMPEAEEDDSADPSPADADGARFRPIADELSELERQRMEEALVASDGNQRRAAVLIQMPLRTFVTKMKRYGLTVRPGRS